MANVQIEDRISEIEAQVAELREQVAMLSTRSANPEVDDQASGWKRLVGMYKDDPAFDKAESYYLEYRAAVDQVDRENYSSRHTATIRMGPER